MTEQDGQMERRDASEELWLVASGLLSQNPDFEVFPPDKITTPGDLKHREMEVLLSCFEVGEPPNDWKEIFSALFPVNPNNKFLWMRLGQYYRGERPDRAVKCWERTLLIDPQRPYMHDNLGDVYRQLAGEGLNDSLKDKRDLLGLTGDQCIERSELHWQEAFRLDPEIWRIWFKLGKMGEEAMILDERADPNLAMTQYRKVLMFKPDDAPSMVRLGWLLARTGDHDEEAVGLLARAQRINPDIKRTVGYITAMTPIMMGKPNILAEIQQKVNEALQDSQDQVGKND